MDRRLPRPVGDPELSARRQLEPPTFDDPAYQRRSPRTARLSGPQRYLTYGALDLDLARNAAPLLAFGNPSSHDFFSARIGCQTFGIYGMDLAALCLRRDER